MQLFNNSVLMQDNLEQKQTLEKTSVCKMQLHKLDLFLAITINTPYFYSSVTMSLTLNSNYFKALGTPIDQRC